MVEEMPGLDSFFGIVEVGVGDRKGDGAKHAFLTCGAECAFCAEVHVVESGCATSAHFIKCLQGSSVDVVRRQFGFHGENGVVKPLLEGESTAGAAEEGHGAVGVHVDKSRKSPTLTMTVDGICIMIIEVGFCSFNMTDGAVGDSEVGEDSVDV